MKVWAADEFEIFKRMMIQKNIELQLQALELIQQRSNQLQGGHYIMCIFQEFSNFCDLFLNSFARMSWPPIRGMGYSEHNSVKKTTIFKKNPGMTSENKFFN